MTIYALIALFVFNVYKLMSAVKDSEEVKLEKEHIKRLACIFIAAMGLPYPFGPIINLFFTKKQQLKFLGKGEE